MKIANFTSRLPLPIQFALGVLLILVLSLLAFSLVMHPPMNEVWLMAVFLSITAVITGLVGYGSYRLGWMDRSPTIR